MKWMTNMKTKIRREFVYEGFGFPVILCNVPMVKVRGVWTPDVDYDALARGVLLCMAKKPSRLTGAEVRFVRQFFEMTLTKFAARFGVTHAAVVKWEKAGEEPANMTWAIEKDLRLFILDRLGAGDSQLARAYRDLDRPVGRQARRIKLDLSA